ncbi:MAG TPA: AAA family ATPase [Stellaceae bacterium]|nr:AAA family ATPase [Stellaceae bacterium]
MYQGFYGLSRPPFAVTPDPSLIFMSPTHREALATIVYGVETRKGFIVCVGEVGTGKSTVVRAFFDQADPSRTKIVYIFAPRIGALEMIQFICSELGVAVPASVFAGLQALQMKLLELFQAGRTVALVIDEAQLLPAVTLEFLRLLSNFETDAEKLIQIVLVGQPELDEMLARHEMRQVNQRVAMRARLLPLTLDESLQYIDHRLRASGATQPGRVLTPEAARIIAEAAGGNPRSINVLADNVLISGFGLDRKPVGPDIARRIVGEFLSRAVGVGTPPPPAPAAQPPPSRRTMREFNKLAEADRPPLSAVDAPANAGAPQAEPSTPALAPRPPVNGSDALPPPPGAPPPVPPLILGRRPEGERPPLPPPREIPLSEPAPPRTPEAGTVRRRGAQLGMVAAAALIGAAAGYVSIVNSPTSSSPAAAAGSRPAASGSGSSQPPQEAASGTPRPVPLASLPASLPPTPAGGRRDLLEAQWLLARLGLYAGPLDGRPSPALDAALQRYFAYSWDPGRPITAAMIDPAMLEGLRRAAVR